MCNINNKNMSETYIRTVRITKEQEQWLNSKEHLNFSGMVRSMLAKEMENEREYR